MNNENMNKGIEDIHRIKLDAEEKQKMLKHLISHASHAKRTNVQPSPFSFFHAFSFRMTASALAILFTVTGGVAFAAEGALPGDVLYPVKIHMSEPVKGFLKVTPEAKTKWESEKAVTRIKEAEKLMEKGRLNEENRNTLEKEFEKNAKTFEKLDKEDSSKKDFEDRVEKEFKKLKEKSEDSSPEQRKVISDLEKNLNKHKSDHEVDS